MSEIVVRYTAATMQLRLISSPYLSAGASGITLSISGDIAAGSAVFQRDSGTPVEVTLVDNACTVPDSLLTESGLLWISLSIGGTETARVGVNIHAKPAAIVDSIYPVGSIYMSINPANPGAILGGTWAAWGSGRVPVGVDAAQSEFETVQKTGGAKTHVLSVGEIPSHAHGFVARDGATGPLSGYTPDAGAVVATNKTGYDTAPTGGGQAHNNLQPYITCYMWLRTA